MALSTIKINKINILIKLIYFMRTEHFSGYFDFRCPGTPTHITISIMYCENETFHILFSDPLVNAY